MLAELPDQYKGYAYEVGVQQVGDPKHSKAHAFVRVARMGTQGKPQPPIKLIWLRDGFDDVLIAESEAHKYFKSLVDAGPIDLAS